MTCSSAGVKTVSGILVIRVKPIDSNSKSSASASRIGGEEKRRRKGEKMCGIVSFFPLSLLVRVMHAKQFLVSPNPPQHQFLYASHLAEQTKKGKLCAFSAVDRISCPIK